MNVRRCRVLVADDEERRRRVLVRILGDRGIDADTASDGRQAVVTTLSGSYDLVILQPLWELMHRPGAVVAKDDLLARVWGAAPGNASNVVGVYVRRLRSRLGEDVITTVRGEGYRAGPG